MRNPFKEPMPADIQTSRGDAPLYSIESPFQGEGMGVRLPAGIPDAESSVISYSGNIREPATQNDSMFGAAGVFAAPDPSSSRSESMFSTDSLFGGDQMFSRDAGAAMSGSDVLSAPAGRAGSGIDVRQDPNFKPPSALAW